jgi:hypothetical protein
MLPLEVIGLLGLLYVFFMIGTVKALRARKANQREAKIKRQANNVITRLATRR